MADKRKAPADGGTSAEVAGAACGGTIPYCHNSTKNFRGQGICALLLHGEANALSARELSQMTRRAQRDITREIEFLRLHGAPICAGRYGYYLPDSAAELERYVKSFNRRLRHITATKTALDDALTEATGQEQAKGW